MSVVYGLVTLGLGQWLWVVMAHEQQVTRFRRTQHAWRKS